MSASAESPGYFAFISYSHQDELWASWLHKALETYRVPSRLVGQTTAAGVIPRRIAPIFRDRDELASATDLSRKVNAALAQSRNLIVICSPQSAASRWVNEEILAFKRIGRSERIFCLIVGGEPNASDLPGRAAEECFAPALRFVTDGAGQLTNVPTEPIAADARAGKDGKANAKLKLIAGLLDVGFDALKQRELQRRNRRMAIVTAAALLIMAVTTTLAITAVIARHDAERRQKQAEDLVGFMLGDLTDKLREVQRLDILESVDDKSMAYFASLPTSDVTDHALSMRVDALQKIGGVRQDQGNIPKALESFHAASALAKAMLQRAPADVARQAEFANSLTWIGKAYWYQGDLEQARANFESASTTLRAAAAARPEDSDLAYKLSSALTNTGRVLELRGDFAAAEPYYRSVLKIFEQLTSREPTKTLWRSELGDAYNNLGKLALEQGSLDRSIAAYSADLAIKIKLASADANNHEAQYNLAISHAILGRTLALCMQMEQARGHLADAIAGFQKLLDFEPKNTEWRYLSARYGDQLGGVLRQQGAFDAAAEADRDSLRVLEALAVTDATNAEWQQELARSRLESARLALATNQAERAGDFVRAARAAADALLANAPEDRNLILLAAQADLVYGALLAQRKETTDARAAWGKARELLAPIAKSGSDVNFASAWATTLLLLDEVDEARSSLAKLGAIGYLTPDFAVLTSSRGLDYQIDKALSQRLADALKPRDGAVASD